MLGCGFQTCWVTCMVPHLLLNKSGGGGVLVPQPEEPREETLRAEMMALAPVPVALFLYMSK